MLLAFLAAWTTARPLASPSRQSVTTASKTLFWSLSIASRADVEGVTVWPAASRMAHFSLTTEGSSSTQRILAIKTSFNSEAPHSHAGGCWLRKERAASSRPILQQRLRQVKSGAVYPRDRRRRSSPPQTWPV